MKLDDATCAFCLGDRASLRFDRKGRPYVACQSCGARAFLVSLRDAVRWLAIVQPLLSARAEELAADADSAARATQMEARVAGALRAILAAVPRAPATTVTATRETTTSKAQAVV